MCDRVSARTRRSCEETIRVFYAGSSLEKETAHSASSAEIRVIVEVAGEL